MLDSQVTFILGAGASCEFDMPVGRELAEGISKLVDVRFREGREIISGDSELFAALAQKYRASLTVFQHAGWLIRDGIQLADSIDDFLSLHEGNQEVTIYGKLAIVKSILTSERNSSLFPRRVHGEQRVEFFRLKDTCFVKLFKALTRGVHRANAHKIFANISFVNFNYDRCLEFFLLHALQKLYGMGERDAFDILSTAKIFHPYGSIGPLKTQTHSAGVDRTI